MRKYEEDSYTGYRVEGKEYILAFNLKEWTIESRRLQSDSRRSCLLASKFNLRIL